jgi:predicted ATP-grasp superfamily ATP-dependent carboligase
MNKNDTKDIAIVYGVETQIGLSLIRELGHFGCEVVAVGKSKNSLGLQSKYVTYPFVLVDRREETIIEQLLTINRLTGAKYLLCVSETDILFFNRVKEQIAPIVPLIPNQENIDNVLSKEYTALAAEKVGIDSPQGWKIEKLEDLLDIKEQLSYPVILKWSNPHDVIKKAHLFKRKIEKIIYCYDYLELERWLRYYAPLEAFPMLQSYIPGYGLGQFFFMHKGQALLSFQHQRVHEWPPEGGFSSLCQSLSPHEHSGLQERSIALLRELAWEGAAMVEYRYDPERDHAVLMEINGRFWGSLPLAYHSQAPFAWYTYMVLGKKKIPDTPVIIKEGILCRNNLVDFKRLIRIVFQQDKIQDKSLKFSKGSEIFDFFAGYFNPKMYYYLFKLSDLKPMFADWKILLTKLIDKLKS